MMDKTKKCVVENISKVSKKNICKLVTVTVITIIVTIVLFISPILNSSDIWALGNDFQFNVLSFSGVIAGFMFTGIGILISAIDKERIRRLWDHHYLDNLYYCSILGIFSNIIDVIFAFVIVGFILSYELKKYIIYAQTLFMILGLVYFIWCTLKLAKLVSRMR